MQDVTHNLPCEVNGYVRNHSSILIMSIKVQILSSNLHLAATAELNV